MKKTARIVVLGATLALAACGSPDSPNAADLSASPSPSPSQAASSTPTPLASTFTVSEKATCSLLVGADEDGPLIQYVNGITGFEASDEAALAELIATRGEVEDIAETANDEMKQLLTALFSEDVNYFKAAGTELLTRCG